MKLTSSYTKKIGNVKVRMKVLEKYTESLSINSFKLIKEIKFSFFILL